MAVLSIVLPAYNEEQNIANTASVLDQALTEQGIDYEMVFISDGSRDGTFQEIQKAAAENSRIKGAEFSRNFGKEAGIFAGLELTTGDAVIVMDCGSRELRWWRALSQTGGRKAWHISFLPGCSTGL